MVGRIARCRVFKPDIYDPQFNRSYAELAKGFGFLIGPARAKRTKLAYHVHRAPTRQPLRQGTTPAPSI